MKKLSKLLAVSMMIGMFLTACGDDGDDMNEELPGIDEPADPELEEDMDDGTDDELDNDAGDDIDG